MPKEKSTKKEPRKTKKTFAKIIKVEKEDRKPVITEENLFVEDSRKKQKYIEAIGRRKTAVARIRIVPVNVEKSAEGGFFNVQGKNYKDYFKDPFCQYNCEASLRKLKSFNRFSVEAKVNGGGLMAQSEAVRHGLARALVAFDINYRKKLKRAGYLTRDPRMKERKKYGFKGARRAPQWGKR